MDLIEGEKLTVSQAILKAGGFGAFANQRKVQVTRVEGGSTRQFYVDVKEILDKGAVGKDVAVQDGDRINVPRAHDQILNGLPESRSSFHADRSGAGC